MTAALILPRVLLSDEPRERRLVVAWHDPDLSIADLRERGYRSGDFDRMRAAHGHKAVAKALPEFGVVRDRSHRRQKR